MTRTVALRTRCNLLKRSKRVRRRSKRKGAALSGSELIAQRCLTTTVSVSPPTSTSLRHTAIIPARKLERSRSMCWPHSSPATRTALERSSAENTGRRVVESADDALGRLAYGRCTAKKELMTAGKTPISILEQEECQRLRACFAAFPTRVYRSRRRPPVLVDVRRRELGRGRRGAAERLCRGRWGRQ